MAGTESKEPESPRSQRRQGMVVIDLGSTRPAVDRCLAAIAVGLMLLGPAAAAAQTLPRVEGPLTMEEAVELARQKNLRVKAADAMRG